MTPEEALASFDPAMLTTVEILERAHALGWKGGRIVSGADPNSVRDEAIVFIGNARATAEPHEQKAVLSQLMRDYERTLDKLEKAIASDAPLNEQITRAQATKKLRNKIRQVDPGAALRRLSRTGQTKAALSTLQAQAARQMLSGSAAVGSSSHGLFQTMPTGKSFRKGALATPSVTPDGLLTHSRTQDVPERETLRTSTPTNRRHGKSGRRS